MLPIGDKEAGLGRLAHANLSSEADGYDIPFKFNTFLFLNRTSACFISVHRKNRFLSLYHAINHAINHPFYRSTKRGLPPWESFSLFPEKTLALVYFTLSFFIDSSDFPGYLPIERFAYPASISVFISYLLLFDHRISDQCFSVCFLFVHIDSSNLRILICSVVVNAPIHVAKCRISS